MVAASWRQPHGDPLAYTRSASQDALAAGTLRPAGDGGRSGRPQLAQGEAGGACRLGSGRGGPVPGLYRSCFHRQERCAAETETRGGLEGPTKYCVTSSRAKDIAPPIFDRFHAMAVPRCQFQGWCLDGRAGYMESKMSITVEEVFLSGRAGKVRVAQIACDVVTAEPFGRWRRSARTT